MCMNLTCALKFLFFSAFAVPALNMGTVLFAMGGYGTFLGWYMRINPKEKMALAPGPALGKTAVRHLDLSPAARVQISKYVPEIHFVLRSRIGARRWIVEVTAQRWHS